MKNPLQVSWYSKVTNQTYCGGSIFSSNLVITSAQCCQDVEVNDNWKTFDIIGGEYNFNFVNGTEQIRTIGYHWIHPGYNQTTHDNDICLLYLNPGFDLSTDYVSSIDLADSTPNESASCTVSGWGAPTVSKEKLAFMILISLPN